MPRKLDPPSHDLLLRAPGEEWRCVFSGSRQHVDLAYQGSRIGLKVGDAVAKREIQTGRIYEEYEKR